MNIFRISGIIVLVISLLWLMNNYKLFELEKNGIPVNMKILDKPGHCIGTKAKYNMKLEYQGKIFIKQIGSSICDDYRIGDYITMKYLDGIDQVLYSNENVTIDFIVGIIFALAGLALVIFKIQ